MGLLGLVCATWICFESEFSVSPTFDGLPIAVLVHLGASLLFAILGTHLHLEIEGDVSLAKPMFERWPLSVSAVQTGLGGLLVTMTFIVAVV